MADKLYFKIGEACKELDIQPYVLRYWETEFPVLKPTKSKAGQRVYSREDLHVIRRIKELLYDEGFTIAGAKKQLDEDPLTAASQADLQAVVVDENPVPAAESIKRPSRKKSSKPPTKPAAKPRSKLASELSAPVAADALTAVAKSKLDTKSSKEVKLLRSGIRDSIKEARAILAILDGVSPRD